MKDELQDFADCALCPHECHVDRLSGQLGACRGGAELRVARAALHFWEEPTISGDAGSGTIFFSGCSLGCAYCQNHAISRGATGNASSPQEVAEMCLALQGQGALNINMVTPTHIAPLVREAIGIARGLGLELPIVWNTSGYELPEQIESNRGFVDIYLTDFKYADPSLAKALSGATDYPERATEALERMVFLAGAPVFDTYDGQQRMRSGVVVRHMLLPGHLDDSKRVIRHVHERHGDDVVLSIMNQYTPIISSLAEKGDSFAARSLRAFPELARQVTDLEYEELLDYADFLGATDYYWQSGETCSESFIPDFD